MLAQDATFGNDYMLTLRTHWKPGPVRATCGGWNHDHSKVLFFLREGEIRTVMALFPKDRIQPLE